MFCLTRQVRLFLQQNGDFPGQTNALSPTPVADQRVADQRVAESLAANPLATEPPVEENSTSSAPPNPGNRWGSISFALPLQPFLMAECCVQGTPDPSSGYITDIRQLDRWIAEACDSAGSLRPSVRPESVRSANPQDHALSQAIHFVQSATAGLVEKLNRLPNVQWTRFKVSFSPYLSLTAQASSPANSDVAAAKEQAVKVETILTQQYEFSAAHRLHCPQWSDEKNRQVFGKCNFPSGHGHNYRLEISIRVGNGPPTERPLIEWLNEIVNRHVIEKVDHRYLNIDLPEFAQLNPSVENIASVIFAWLQGQFDRPDRLLNVRVYETEKTWADFSNTQ